MGSLGGWRSRSIPSEEEPEIVKMRSLSWMGDPHDFVVSGVFAVECRATEGEQIPLSCGLGVIKLIFVRKVKTYRRSVIQTHDNNFARENILGKK